MIVKKKRRQRYSRRFRCHYFASMYALQLINSELIDEDDLTVIPHSTLSVIVGKAVKLPELAPDIHRGRLTKIFSINDKTPVATKQLTNNINYFSSLITIGQAGTRYH